ncbi:MAG: AAA family ATPase [Anaerolineae bacterium]|nr:AAA family ATPase [Anaerolineae bacterium]
MSFDPTFQQRLSRYLPNDLLNQFPDTQALTKALRRLNSLHQAVLSFLPQYVAENERLHHEVYGGLRPGTFMFADVSGFTALSEKLQAASGREGAEILTAIINSYFATMLEILAKSNGQLLKFAGDALLTFFPARPGEDEAPLAIRTGLRMQRAMVTGFQPIRHADLESLIGPHSLELSMSIGIARGKLLEAVIGNTQQRDHMIQGTLPGMAMRAEEAGTRDDVIVDAELYDSYHDQFDMTALGEGFYRVEDTFGDRLDDYEFVIPRRRRGQSAALFDFAEANLLQDLQRQVERLDSVARFVAPDVVNKLAFRGDHIEPENRPATVIFCHVTGFAEILEQWGENELSRLTTIINRYYGIMQRTIVANGGSLNRSDPYRHGAKLLITFGAPIAHPDDQERAVTTALEMNRQLALLNNRLRDELPDHLQRWPFITQCLGITYGPVFAGEAGWRARREYTVMGDDVNLAARLMSKGESGQIMISARVWERVNPHFETEVLPPLQLKGKSKLTQAYLVKASAISALNIAETSDTPFVGHDLQLLTLTYALQQARGPRRRQAFALIGDAGVGKTRIAKQVVEAAEATGFSVAWASCQLRSTQGQSVWGAIIFQLLQLEQAKSKKAQQRLLNVRLGEMELGELESVFASQLFVSDRTPDKSPSPKPKTAVRDMPKTSTGVFDLIQGPSDLEKSGIFGAVRREVESSPAPGEKTGLPLWKNLQKQTSFPDSVVRLLQAFADETPTLLIFDDIHQADAETLAILNQALEAITQSRLMVLATHEPDENLDVRVRRKLSIDDLDQDEAYLMAARVLGADDVGPHLRDFLWQRTGGRPLFVETLIKLLQDNAHIKQTGPQIELAEGAQPANLPDHVRQLIVSHTDRLSHEARTVLEVASVIGTSFTLEALLAIGEIGLEIRLETRLGDLIHSRLINMQPDQSYRFNYGVVQTAVYESLNRMQRLKLHRQSADYWQKQPDADQHVLTVADHLVKGGMPTRASELIFEAANQAEQSQHITRAIELVSHALDIFPHDESLQTKLTQLQQLAAASTVSASAGSRNADEQQRSPCPHCGASPNLQNKVGRNRSGTQRYRCKQCRRSYTPKPIPDQPGAVIDKLFASPTAQPPGDQASPHQPGLLNLSSWEK